MRLPRRRTGTRPLSVSVDGGFSIDALKKEAESLMIPEEKQMYYVAAQIVQLKEAEKRLERKEAEKRLGLERLELEWKEAEKRLELERFKMEITKTGLLWKLRTQTQRHALELFLFNCWERFQECSDAEIEQIRSKIKKFPAKPAEVKEPDKSMLQQVIGLDIPTCNQIREDLLGGVVFPRLSANVMYGVLSQRLHQSDAGRDLYVGDDEGDAVIKFYETLARRYGYTMTKLKRDYQVAYSEMLSSGG